MLGYWLGHQSRACYSLDAKVCYNFRSLVYWKVCWIKTSIIRERKGKQKRCSLQTFIWERKINWFCWRNKKRCFLPTFETPNFFLKLSFLALPLSGLGTYGIFPNRVASSTTLILDAYKELDVLKEFQGQNKPYSN